LAIVCFSSLHASAVDGVYNLPLQGVIDVTICNTLYINHSNNQTKTAKCMKLFLTTLLGFAFWGYLSAQSPTANKPYIPPSPTAANLGLYVDQTVGNYSGVPEISIPLYTVSAGSLKLPIALSYHASGIRKSDEGGWVGANWSLLSGGVISRVKKDRDDFGSKGFYQINPANRSCARSFDQEPDMFYINCNGLSGKFVLDYNGTGHSFAVRQIVKSGVKIAQIPNGWIVTTTGGDLYFFEQKEYITETNSASGAATESETFISAWYLTKIVAANGETIELTYSPVTPKIARTFQRHWTQKIAGWTPHWMYSHPSCTSFYNWYQQNNVSLSFNSTSETQTDEVVLQSIKANNVLVDFETDERIDLNTVLGNGRKLKRMVVYKGETTASPVYTTFNFLYNYYSSGSASHAKVSKRLRLIRVQEQNGTLQKAPYLFSYNGNTLPDKGPSYNMGGMLDNPVQGLLESITFPTGGSSKYLFEPHQYVDIFGQSNSNGGARIKRVEQFSDGATTHVKNFQYEGGRLMGTYIPAYQINTFSPYFASDCPMPGQTTFATITYSEHHYYDASILGELSNNQVIGYDKVAVLQGDNGEFGKTVTEYENVQPSTTNGGVSLYMPLPVSNKNGLLKSKSEYKYSNGQHIIVQKQTSEYESAAIEGLTARRRHSGGCFDYNTTIEWIRLKQDVVWDYNNDASNYVESKRTYSYGNPLHLLPTQIETQNSQGELLVTTMKYPHEKAAEVGGVYSTMVGRNIIAPLMEQTERNNGAVTQLTQVAYAHWSPMNGLLLPETVTSIKNPTAAGAPTQRQQTRFYHYDGKGNPLDMGSEHDIRTSYIWAYKKSFPIAEVKNAAYHDMGATGFEDPEEVYWHSEGYMAHDLTTDSRTGKYAYHCPPNWPGTTGPAHYFYVSGKGEYVFSCWVKTSGSYTGNGSLVLHAYNISDPSMAVYPAGNSESYKTVSIANTNGQWKYVEVRLNMDLLNQAGPFPTQLGLRAYITNQSTGEAITIDDLRFHPSHAKMTTYTYDPLVGITSTTSANNKTSYFEYDALNRVTLIRDHHKNIVRKVDYHYQVPQGNAPLWQKTGSARCISNANGAYTGDREEEEIDINPHSPSYGQLRWLNTGPSADCPILIYAQLDIRNRTYDSYSGRNFAYGDVYITLVNALGQPVNVSGLTVNLRSDERTCDLWGCYGNTNNLPVVVNGSEALVFSGLLQEEEWDYYNFVYSFDRIYTVLPGAGYTPR
jgi:hypothetical protein